MPFTFRGCLALPLILLSLAVSGCVESDSPILASDAGDTIPLRDGFYFNDDMTFFIRTYDAKHLIVNIADDGIAREAVMKDLGRNIYLVQYGHVSDSKREYLLLRISADGNGLSMRVPDCNGANGATFARAGVPMNKSVFGCDIGAATPAALLRAYRDIAQSDGKWENDMAYDSSPAALRRFERQSVPKAKP